MASTWVTRSEENSCLWFFLAVKDLRFNFFIWPNYFLTQTDIPTATHIPNGSSQPMNSAHNLQPSTMDVADCCGDQSPSMLDDTVCDDQSSLTSDVVNRDDQSPSLWDDTEYDLPSPSIVYESGDETESENVDSDEFDDISLTEDDDGEVRRDLTLSTNQKGERVINNIMNITLKQLGEKDRIPYDIDGSCAFRLTGDSKSNLVLRCKDGRPWKSKDSGTKWRKYTSVRYKNCGGGLRCLNTDCRRQMEIEGVACERDGFDKKLKTCNMCGIIGSHFPCSARKYLATKEGNSKLTVDVYHVGTHTCSAKPVVERQSEVVAQALAINPRVKPSGIQSNTIMTMLRNRRSWEEIKTGAQKFRCTQSISNEKKKQVKLRE